MEEVGSLLATQLMSAVERLTASEQRLTRALALERAHQRWEVGSGRWAVGSGVARASIVPLYSQPRHPWLP